MVPNCTCAACRQHAACVCSISCSSLAFCRCSNRVARPSRVWLEHSLLHQPTNMLIQVNIRQRCRQGAGRQPGWAGVTATAAHCSVTRLLLLMLRRHCWLFRRQAACSTGTGAASCLAAAELVCLLLLLLVVGKLRSKPLPRQESYLVALAGKLPQRTRLCDAEVVLWQGCREAAALPVMRLLLLLLQGVAAGFCVLTVLQAPSPARGNCTGNKQAQQQWWITAQPLC